MDASNTFHGKPCRKAGHTLRFSYGSKQCVECKNQARREWCARNPDRVRKRKLKARFGLTSEQFTEMFNEQFGLCAICGSHIAEKKLSIDHCHTTNMIRGLLCQPCNLGLGSFRDNPKTLEKAVLYLRKSPTGIKSNGAR